MTGKPTARMVVKMADEPFALDPNPLSCQHDEKQEENEEKNQK
jgi:hypothetical protein